MQLPQQHLRINLCEMKSQIVKKLGPERSRQYFYLLNRLLSLKITKFEFNRICLQIVGRENIQLHNQLMGSILKNACQAKVPPKLHTKEVSKLVDAAENDSVAPSDGHQQNVHHSNLTQTLNPAIQSNGGIFPPSPRKARSGTRERKTGVTNQLGLNGKIEALSCLPKDAGDRSFHSRAENGKANLPSVGELKQHDQVCTRGQGNEEQFHDPNTLSETNVSQHDSFDVHSRDSIQVENARVVKEASSTSLLQAPLGISLWSASIGGTPKDLSLASRRTYVTSYDSGVLFHTETLRDRMEQIATAHGLGGVSMDCANLLNNGLDSYLKRLIRSSIESVRARSGHDLTKNMAHKHHTLGKVASGFWPGHQSLIKSHNWPLEGFVHAHRSFCSVSLLDFRVAMELNPQQLGVYWPLLLEKICTHSSVE
ncbi:hypothetical protein Ancab_029772 [Ancistrocladus abbreviatus]